MPIEEENPECNMRTHPLIGENVGLPFPLRYYVKATLDDGRIVDIPVDKCMMHVKTINPNNIVKTIDDLKREEMINKNDRPLREVYNDSQMHFLAKVHPTLYIRYMASANKEFEIIEEEKRKAQIGKN